MNEVELWGKEVPRCQQATNYPYVQCDCPVHDTVAKLLDIDSTRANGYKSTKTRGFTVRDHNGELVWIEPEEREAAAVEAMALHPPRPRKPKDLTSGMSQYGVAAQKTFEEDERERQRYLQNLKQRAEEFGIATTEIYEIGQSQPVDVILNEYLYDDGDLNFESHGGKFSLRSAVNEPTMILYERNGRAITERLPSMNDAPQVMQHMIEQMDLAETLVNEVLPLQAEWR